MTLNDVQRGALVMFAARAAGRGGSLEQMKAIAYCIRNRVKAGWFDGQWLTIMEHAEEAAAHVEERVLLDPNNRALQRLISDIDEIYYGARGDPSRERQDKQTTAQHFAAEGGDLEDAIGRSCYWCKVNEPIRPWFKQNIIDKQQEHPNRASMGLVAFYD